MCLRFPAASVVWLVLLSLAIPCGLNAQESHPDSEMQGTPDLCQFIDWAELAEYLDNMNMASAFFMNPPPPPHKPARQYARATTFDTKANTDSLGLETFLALPSEEREARARLAHRYRERVRRFHQLVLRQLDIVQSGSVALHSNINNRSVTDCIKALVTATGLNPSAADAWYDLSYFTNLVGDKQRSLQCLAQAQAVLELLGEDACPDFHQRVALDAAWICRDLGLGELALDWAAQARDLGADPSECTLVEGLALADMGRFTEACEVSEKIGPIRTRKRIIYSDVNKRANALIPSEYAERWVKGMAYLAQGDYELACHMVKLVRPVREYPHATRFWNDVGLIHELSGKPEASSFYGLAVIWSPLLLYYPIDGIRGAPSAFGQSGTGLEFLRTHRCLYMAGSLFSYAAMTAVESEITEDVRKREQLARHALEAMDICRRRGIRPTSALVMRGRFLFAREDYAGAFVALNQAVEELAEHDQPDAELYYFTGLAGLQVNLTEVAAGYLEKAAELAPTWAGVWSALGVAKGRMQDMSGARAALDKSLALAPELAKTWYNRGLLNYQQAEYSAAASDLEVSISLDPDLDQASRLLRLANRAEQSGAVDVEYALGDGETRDAITSGQEGIPLGQQDMSSLENGLITVRSGHPQPRRSIQVAYTLKDVRRLSEIYAEDPSRQNRRELAQGLIRVGQAAEARDLLLPFWPDATAVTEHTLMLEADRALGDTGRARLLAGSLAVGPPTQGDATFWALVAFICLDAGLKEEGMLALDAAISLDPENMALKRHRNLLSSQ